MLCKNTKQMAHSSDDDTGIVTDVLKEDTLAPKKLRICLDHLKQTSTDLIEENGFPFKTTR